MKILIGTVLKPHGITGQLKISDLTDGYSAIENLQTVTIGDKNYAVLSKKSVGGAIYLSVKGVADRNAADAMRGKDVYCEKDEIEVKEGRYFIEDLLGCDLYLSSGKFIGKIVDVILSNVDIFKAETDEGDCYFPFLKKLNAIVDVEERKITVDAKTFTEVCLYQ